jgi:hypothetical protein
MELKEIEKAYNKCCKEYDYSEAIPLADKIIESLQKRVEELETMFKNQNSFRYESPNSEWRKPTEEEMQKLLDYSVKKYVTDFKTPEEENIELKAKLKEAEEKIKQLNK